MRLLDRLICWAIGCEGKRDGPRWIDDERQLCTQYKCKRCGGTHVVKKELYVKTSQR